MGGTHHKLAYSAGVPLFGLGGMIPIPGTVYFVDGANGDDALSGDSPSVQSGGGPKKTLSNVQAAMTANQNDVAVLIGNSSAGSSFRESSNLLWTKNLTHILGTSYNLVAQRVSLRETSGGTAVTKMLDNSASGCLFAQFLIQQGQSTAETQMAVEESGERNTYVNMQIAGGIQTTAGVQAGTRDISIVGGGEHLFQHCMFGMDTVDRKLMASVGLTGQSARNLFEDCYWSMFTSTGTTNFLRIALSGIQRFLMFKDCVMTNTSTYGGGAEMTEGLDVTADAGGIIVLQNTWVYGCGLVENSSQSGIVIVGGGNPDATSALGVGNTG